MSDQLRLVHHNPEGLLRNPAFTQVVSVTRPATTVDVGGPNGVNAAGEIVAKDDLRAQTEQVFRNLQTALHAAGASLEQVIKWTINLVDSQPLEQAFEAFQRVWGRRANPPLITLARVSGLAEPDALGELDAVAVVPAPSSGS